MFIALIIPILLLAIDGFAAYYDETHMSMETKEKFERYDRFRKQNLQTEEKK